MTVRRRWWPRHTFFSRRASWMTLYPTAQPATLRFVFSRMDEEKGNLLDLSFRTEDGRVPHASFSATPSHITVTTGGLGAPHAIAYVASGFDAVIDTEGLGLDIASLKPALRLGRPFAPRSLRCPPLACRWRWRPGGICGACTPLRIRI